MTAPPPVRHPRDRTREELAGAAAAEFAEAVFSAELRKAMVRQLRASARCTVAIPADMAEVAADLDEWEAEWARKAERSRRNWDRVAHVYEAANARRAAELGRGRPGVAASAWPPWACPAPPRTVIR